MKFLRKMFKTDASQGERSSITVLHVTVGTAPAVDTVSAIRQIVLKAQSIDFRFLNPGSFTIYFPGDADGIAQASELAAALNHYASEKSVGSFGIGIRTGDCTFARGDKGGFATFPVGGVVSEAMKAAVQEASA